MSVLQIIGLAVVAMVANVEGHGKMVDPPARSTVQNPNTFSTYVAQCPFRGNINYSDKGMFCGGRGTQHDNVGKCGPCGDNYSDTYPRNHDYGGKYATDITAVRAYKVGEIITIRVLMTASHLGSFQFRVCPQREGPGTGDILGDCFSNSSLYHLLTVAETGATNFTGSNGAINEARLYEANMQLPAGLTCPYGCNLQWWYRCGNNPEPTYQEHFVNCADILIMNCDDFRSGNHGPWCAYGPSDELLSCLDEQGNNSSSSASGSATTQQPTTQQPTTQQPTTQQPTTQQPTTQQPTTQQPTTQQPTTQQPTTQQPTTQQPTTQQPTTQSPTTTDMTCGECIPMHGADACSVCCTANVTYQGTVSIYDQWCSDNCPAFCPPTHCLPPTTSYAKITGCEFPGSLGQTDDDAGAYVPTCDECTESGASICSNECCSQNVQTTVTAYNPVYQQWCVDNCNTGYCPNTFCQMEQETVWTFNCDRRLSNLVRELLKLEQEKSQP